MSSFTNIRLVSFMKRMAKKVLLANPCGKVADLAFDSAAVGLVDSWVGAISY